MVPDHANTQLLCVLSTGRVSPDWQDQRADNEHCWCDQGLDVDLLQLLRVQGTCYKAQPSWLHFLL